MAAESWSGEDFSLLNELQSLKPFGWIRMELYRLELANLDDRDPSEVCELRQLANEIEPES